MDLFFAFVASLVPSILIYVYLRRLDADKPGYREDCKKAFWKGVLSSFPVCGCALLISILLKMSGLGDKSMFLKEFIRTFVTAALLEETFKFRNFRKVVKESSTDLSRVDLVSYMVLVGMGFETIESFVYLIESGPIHVIVRGLTMMHGIFGYIMGKLYSKGVKTGKKIWYFLSFFVPWFYHGLYDFTLSEEYSGTNDFFIFTPVMLAALSLILVFVMIFWFRKAKKKQTEDFTEILIPAPRQSAEEAADITMNDAAEE